MTTPVIKLVELTDGQASPHATVNEALRQLDGHKRVISRTTSAQPGSVTNGAAYIMPASPTGTDWAGFAQHDLVIGIGGAWLNYVPVEGWGPIWVNDEDVRVDFDGSTWAAATSGSSLVDYKDSVKIATTANITLSGEQTIDGVLTSADRILVKDQTTASENGIYVTAAGAWSRATDFDTDAEVTGGALIPVEEGTISQDFLYILTTNDPITVGSTSLVFSQYGGPGTDSDAIHDNVSGEIAAITEKTTPVSADLILIEDSAASNAKKKMQLGNLASNRIVDQFTGGGVDFTEGVQSAVTLSTDPGSINNIDVHVGGAYEQKADIVSLVGTTLTVAWPAGSYNAEVKYSALLSLGTPADASVTNKKLAANVITTTGTSAAFVASLGETWQTNKVYQLKFHTANADACTVSDGTTAYTLKTRDGYSLAPGVISGVFSVVYDGTDLMLADYTPQLLAEQEVTGAAVTDVDFSGLDIATHKSYRIEIESGSPAGAANVLSMYVNGDTTATNYYNQYMVANGATLASGRVNTAEVMGIAAVNSLGNTVINLFQSAAGYVRAYSQYQRYLGVSLETVSYDWSKTATTTNLVSLKFRSATASGIIVGSKIRIYRGDV